MEYPCKKLGWISTILGISNLKFQFQTPFRFQTPDATFENSLSNIQHIKYSGSGCNPESANLIPNGEFESQRWSFYFRERPLSLIENRQWTRSEVRATPGYYSRGIISPDSLPSIPHPLPFSTRSPSPSINMQSRQLAFRKSGTVIRLPRERLSIFPPLDVLITVKRFKTTYIYIGND